MHQTAVAYLPEALDLFGRCHHNISTATKGHYNQLFRSLKEGWGLPIEENNLSTVVDALWLTVGHHNEIVNVNLVQNKFNPMVVGQPIFSTQGMKGSDGSSSGYLQTGYRKSIGSLSAPNLAMGVFLTEVDNIEESYMIGNSGIGGHTNYYIAYQGTGLERYVTRHAKILNADFTQFPTSSQNKGLLVVDRKPGDSAKVRIISNGSVLVENNDSLSNNNDNINFQLGGIYWEHEKIQLYSHNTIGAGFVLDHTLDYSVLESALSTFLISQGVTGL